MFIWGLVSYINMCNLFQWASLLRICSGWRGAEDVSLVTKLNPTLWNLRKKNSFETIDKKGKKEETKLNEGEKQINFNSLTPHSWIHKRRLKRLGYRMHNCTVITLLKCWYTDSSNYIPLLQKRLFLIASARGEIFRY